MAARSCALGGLLFAAGAAAGSELLQARPGAHGYRSSEPWLPRVPVVTAPTGEELVAEAALPGHFDWRSASGRSWVTTDLNQHIPLYCGSCWIHGTIHALNDRLKLYRGARFPDVLLSRQAIMNCVPDASGQGPPPGCNGGDAWMIHKYMHENKVPDDSCMPYVGMNLECKPENVCRNCFHNQTIDASGHPFFTPGPCFGVKHWTGYGVGDYGHLKGEAAMMKEIYARGPIVCSSATDDTFVLNYSSNPGVLSENVYITDFPYTPAMIDHLMEITGWGETASGTKYWVVRNSWGTYWGDMGWVKIRRGVNQMQIESSCDWAVPSFDDVEEQLKSKVLGDYVNGVHVESLGGLATAAAAKPAEAAMAAALAVPAEALERPGNGPVVLTAVVAGGLGLVLGSSLTQFLGRRARPRQPGLLG